MSWRNRAIEYLKDSLHPVPVELNEIDWKSGLSTNNDRLAQHISAFTNQSGGGFLVFGVNNDGSMFSIQKEDADSIIQKLGNIASNNLNRAIKIEHSIIDYNENALLFIYIPEQADKPIHLRGKDLYQCYNRSAGQTVKMAKTSVHFLIASSNGVTFEEQIAKEGLTFMDCLKHINVDSLFRILDRNTPSSSDIVLETLINHNIIKRQTNGYAITNLGAILFAKDIKQYPHLAGRSVHVLHYKGVNNQELLSQQIGMFGYAAGFEGLITYIMGKIDHKEIIEGSLRKNVPIYPQIAIREFVANALVHQDFSIDGMPITIEIYANRIVITNPGSPLNDVNRFIDLPPRSRNENLAQALFLFNICERRGSGVDRAITALESQKLPAPKITKGESFTRIFLFGPKELADMTKDEKIRACYQHTCLLYESGLNLNNQSVRDRFGISKNNSAIASRIISDTVDAGYIKIVDPVSGSRKFVAYIPFYA